MPFCTRCGCAVNAGDRFCYDCGNKLPVLPSTLPVPLHPAPPHPPTHDRFDVVDSFFSEYGETGETHQSHPGIVDDGSWVYGFDEVLETDKLDLEIGTSFEETNKLPPPVENATKSRKRHKTEGMSCEDVCRRAQKESSEAVGQHLAWMAQVQAVLQCAGPTQPPMPPQPKKRCSPQSRWTVDNPTCPHCGSESHQTSASASCPCTKAGGRRGAGCTEACLLKKPKMSRCVKEA